MKRKTCEVCGCRGTAEDMVVHRVIPEEIAKEAGVSDSGAVVLCINCRNELDTWYSRRVADLTYDTGTRWFIPRPPAEMAKEYQATYRAFAEYKGRQRKKR